MGTILIPVRAHTGGLIGMCKHLVVATEIFIQGECNMKNIQVIDGATNCAFSVYQISEECFYEIFPGERQNIEFIDELILRIGEQRAGKILTPVWQHRVEKENIIGLHGTLFFEMEFKKKYYPNKRESDLDDPDLQKR
jgi:hypothetical protein